MGLLRPMLAPPVSKHTLLALRAFSNDLVLIPENKLWPCGPLLASTLNPSALPFVPVSSSGTSESENVWSSSVGPGVNLNDDVLEVGCAGASSPPPFTPVESRALAAVEAGSGDRRDSGQDIAEIASLQKEVYTYFWSNMEAHYEPTIPRVWSVWEDIDWRQYSEKINEVSYCRCEACPCVCSEIFCSSCFCIGSHCECQNSQVRAWRCALCHDNIPGSFDLHLSTFCSPQEPPKQPCAGCIAEERIVDDVDLCAYSFPNESDGSRKYNYLDGSIPCSLCNRVDAQELMAPCDADVCKTSANSDDEHTAVLFHECCMRRVSHRSYPSGALLCALCVDAGMQPLEVCDDSDSE
jgi:hypothetical protein